MWSWDVTLSCLAMDISKQSWIDHRSRWSQVYTPAWKWTWKWSWSWVSSKRQFFISLQLHLNTKKEQEYCQCHRRNTKLSADFEEPCPGATGRHQMAEIDLQHNSHNTARCFVHLVNNYTALNPHCWDLVKLFMKVLVHWGICLFWKRKFLKNKNWVLTKSNPFKAVYLQAVLVWIPDQSIYQSQKRISFIFHWD